jgi:uncharacterized protein YjdB
MTQSANYDATKQDSRVWRTTGDAAAAAKDAAAVAHAAALQTSTQDTLTLESISVTPATVTLDISNGETQQLTTVQTPSSAHAGLTYVSSDATKATVSNTGLITPVAAGSATITVKATADNSITDTCVVTVQA